MADQVKVAPGGNEGLDIPRHMRAVRIYRGGGPETMAVEMVAVPVPAVGELLVRVDATTVISSEIATREGVSTAALPLILGNEFIGTVVAAPGGEVEPGVCVAGGYGGYGYTRDGAWADYVVVDVAHAFPFVSTLDLLSAVAIPASFTAASGSLRALGEVGGRSLLIRGGTSGVGLAVATLALAAGARVIASTRDPGKRDRLLAHGVHEVVVDGPDFSQRVRELVPGGVDLAVDLLGLASLSETLLSLRDHGVGCLTGLLEDQQRSIHSGVREDRATSTFPHALEFIPPTVRMTVGGVVATPRTPAMVQEWMTGVETGRYRMPVDSVFTLDQMPTAHRRRKEPASFGKVVIAVSPAAVEEMARLSLGAASD
jgi:NADPH:quinone reductase-like Zn-dependent oxidoreductase